MPIKKTFKGDSIQGERPVWEPLEQLVGWDLSGFFMWMFEVRLEDGTEVHAYKHRDTRSYIHAATDGRVFHYTQFDRYREVSRAKAIEAAFAGWWRVLHRIYDADLLFELLHQACEKAESGEQFSMDNLRVVP